MRRYGPRISSQVIDAKTLTDLQIAEPARALVVDSRVDERGQAAVGGAYAQRSVAGTGQLHRRIDDAMQRHIQVKLGADFDDDPNQLFHLVASCQQLIKLFVHSTHRLAPAVPDRRGYFRPVSIHTN